MGQCMIGAIAGDIIGSVYEAHNTKRYDFPLFDPLCRFTDDTVLTVAVADALLNDCRYVEKFKEYYSYYPYAGYGFLFHRWAASSDTKPYNSFGNGSAMRVSPVGFAFDSLEEVLNEAKKSAEVTHNHPEGIKGAQATASAIFLARKGSSKTEIKKYIENCDPIVTRREETIENQNGDTEIIYYGICNLDRSLYEDKCIVVYGEFRGKDEIKASVDSNGVSVCGRGISVCIHNMQGYGGGKKNLPRAC